MAPEHLSIGDLARDAGCTVQIIRHYEKIGLLPEPRRTGGNRRIYSEDQASRLQFIRHSRELDSVWTIFGNFSRFLINLISPAAQRHDCPPASSKRAGTDETASVYGTGAKTYDSTVRWRYRR